MTEIYKTIRPGHLFQTNRTGAGPDYSFDYSNNYNSLPFIEMSKLRLNLLKKYIPNFKSVCDFGYGNGAFIEHCHEQGYESYAYDISDYPAPEGVIRLHDINNVDVDVLTFFDSLEHIFQEDLIPFLQSLSCKYFVISVPWCHHTLGEEWFYNWKHRKPNEHFHHFDTNGIIGLLVESGCKIIHVCNDEDQIRKSTDD